MTPEQERQVSIALNRIKAVIAGMRSDGIPEGAIIEAIRQWVEDRK